MSYMGDSPPGAAGLDIIGIGTGTSMSTCCLVLGGTARYIILYIILKYSILYSTSKYIDHTVFIRYSTLKYCTIRILYCSTVIVSALIVDTSKK